MWRDRRSALVSLQFPKGVWFPLNLPNRLYCQVFDFAVWVFWPFWTILSWGKGFGVRKDILRKNNGNIMGQDILKKIGVLGSPWAEI